jgi:hypothetical protein
MKKMHKRQSFTAALRLSLLTGAGTLGLLALGASGASAAQVPSDAGLLGSITHVVDSAVAPVDASLSQLGVPSTPVSGPAAPAADASPSILDRTPVVSGVAAELPNLLAQPSGTVLAPVVSVVEHTTSQLPVVQHLVPTGALSGVTSPVVGVVDGTLGGVTMPVLDAVAPVLGVVDGTLGGVTAPVLDAVAPVLGVVDGTLGGVTTPVLDAIAPVVDPVVEVVPVPEVLPPVADVLPPVAELQPVPAAVAQAADVVVPASAGPQDEKGLPAGGPLVPAVASPAAGVEEAGTVQLVPATAPTVRAPLLLDEIAGPAAGTSSTDTVSWISEGATAALARMATVPLVLQETLAAPLAMTAGSVSTMSGAGAAAPFAAISAAAFLLVLMLRGSALRAAQDGLPPGPSFDPGSSPD